VIDEAAGRGLGRGATTATNPHHQSTIHAQPRDTA
jgi:hypothetical protein